MNRISKEDIVNAFVVFYKEYERSPRCLDVDKLPFGTAAVKRKFGSWNKALLAADLPINVRQNSSITVKCMECQTPIERTPSHLKRANGNYFCCVTCSNTWRRKQNKTETKRGVCEAHIENGNKYCGEKCRLEATTVNETQTLREYKKGYTSWQFHGKVRGLAKTRMERTKRKKICAVCGYNLYVECCHIKPISKFSEMATLEEVNRLDNLVYLCPNHHWEFDNGYLYLET